VVDNEQMLDAVRHHVLHASERIENVHEWPGQSGLVVYTSSRDFAVALDRRMLISRAEWVAGLVVATREDVETEGLPETYGVLLLTDGSAIDLSDERAVSEIGRRVGSDLDPVAFAEILVAWHPWATAVTAVILERGQVQRALGRSDLPTFEPPMLSPIDGGLVLTFFSSMLHSRELGGKTRLTVYEWTVLVPTGGEARWERRAVLDGVPADR
jgi:hypothetical protein